MHQNMTTIAQKLKAKGYYSVALGKWHCGMSRPSLVPGARGFDYSLGYLAGSEDHFKHTNAGFGCKQKSQSHTATANRAVGDVGATSKDKHLMDMYETDHPVLNAKAQYTGVYNGEIFTQKAMEIISAHGIMLAANGSTSGSTKPALFMYLAFANCHHPMQVPAQWLGLYPAVHNTTRRTYQAMVSYTDAAIGNVTTALKNAGMWQRTLVFVMSDNGGPSLTDLDTSNNFPLRGGKYSLFDGGMRVTAFLSGGFLDASRHNTQVHGLCHTTDVFATLCTVAGVSMLEGVELEVDKDGNALPAIDAVDLWPMITGANTSSPRTELPLSIGPPGDTGCPDNIPPAQLQRNNLAHGAAVIGGPEGRYKIVVGGTCPAHWSGPNSPNGTEEGPLYHDCGTGGCLFDLLSDEGEHIDLATSANYSGILTALRERVAQLNSTVYQTPYDASPLTALECASAGVQQVQSQGVWAPSEWCGGAMRSTSR
jgi:hypothetical protein